MQGNFDQVINIVTFGNSFLQNPSPQKIEAFEKANVIFTICEYVHFVDIRHHQNQLQQKIYATNPSDWLYRLHYDGYFALRLHPLSAIENAISAEITALQGGGEWVIEAIKSSASDFWRDYWHMSDSKWVREKKWRVSQIRVLSDYPTKNPNSIDLEKIKRRLQKNLIAIEEFARDNNCKNFADTFASALQTLLSPKPFHYPCFSKETPLIIQQLYAASMSAWVFGGMGSWNDQYYEGEKQIVYEKLTGELYELLNEAIMAAVNATAVFPNPE